MKKKGITSFVSVVESITIPTSETIPPQPTENPLPQTFKDFDIEFDPSVTLGNFFNEPHSPNPNPNPEQHQQELAKVLSDIELFDQEFSSPLPENPNTQPQQLENPQPHSPQPEHLQPHSPQRKKFTTTLSSTRTSEPQLTLTREWKLSHSSL